MLSYNRRSAVRTLFVHTDKTIFAKGQFIIGFWSWNLLWCTKEATKRRRIDGSLLNVISIINAITFEV